MMRFTLKFISPSTTMRRCSLVIAGLIMFHASTQIYARPLEPHYFFDLYGQGCAPPTDIVSSVEEASEKLMASYAACNPQVIRPLSIYPNPESTSNRYVNGNSTFYAMTLETWDNQAGVWKTQSTPAGAFATRYECPLDVPTTSYLQNGGTRLRVECVPVESQCKDSPSAGNPISLATGVKRQDEVDYSGVGANSLRFIRTYRSDRKGWIDNNKLIGIDFTNPVPDFQKLCYPGIGSLTGKPYCFRSINAVDGAGVALANDFAVLRGNGRVIDFGTATTMSPAVDINDRAVKLTDGNLAVIGWQVYNATNDSIEHYDAAGQIQTSRTRNGQVQTYSYSDSTTPPSIARTSGLLLQVTDHFGRKLSFTYDSEDRVATMTDPGGNVYAYGYDEATSIVLPGQAVVGNQTSVTFPDGTKRLYWYNEQDKTASKNLPYALTGITDENGVRFATFKYNVNGKAITTEHAGNVEMYVVSYPSLHALTSVTDPVGSVRTYRFQTLHGIVRGTGQNQPGGAGCGPSANSIIYDANGNIASQTDFNGNKATYAYDLSRNLETQRVEASGTAKARTINTTWHANYRLPLTIAEPNKITTFTYDASGNLLTKSEQATTDANGSLALAAVRIGTARTWNYTYNSVGQVLSATDPNGKVTTNTYDAMGNLATVTNALGQVTTFSNYDANGRVGTIADPNGLVTTLTYSPRGWLTSKSVGGQVTVYTYDGVGQLIAVTQPDGSTINYTYDDAHRLTDIADSLGNSIHYTLDAMGNRTAEQVKDPSGTLARQTSRAYDALNRLQQITGGMQ